MEWDLGRRLVPECDDVLCFRVFSHHVKLVLLTLLGTPDRPDRPKLILRFHLYSTLSKAVRDGITGNDLVEQR
jgi:hypothetical protein